MAAGQQKKRSNAASVMRFSFHGSSRGKKAKKLGASDVVLNMTSRVSLVWDDGQNKAVAKREQVGITWRDMAPFLDPIPQLRSCLADVFTVPQEFFVLESVTDLLSYEVWETYLSEQEKKLLIQFLPMGVDVDHVVRSLLAGENLHFGNPVCKWGASLCAGNLHPDAVVHKEQQLRTNWNAYFMTLKNYHTEIIERLSKLKERWTNCKDPEKDIEEETMRNGITKSIPPVAPEKDRVFSCSEKEQPYKDGILYGDTEYMSYFKISKKQHQLVTNIKHSSDGIQPKSLKRVLGDIKHFNIQPYATFEEEERKRLHGHWLQLANKDIPATFENIKERRLLVDKWRKSVQDELAGMKEWMDKKDQKDSLKWSSLQQVDERDLEQESALDVQDEGCIQPAHHFTHCHNLERNSSLNSCQELNPSSPDQGKSFDILQSTSGHPMHPPNNDHHVEKIPSLNSPQEHKLLVDQEGCGNAVEKATTSLALPKIDGCEDANEDTKDLEPSPSIDGHHHGRIPPLSSHKQLGDGHHHGRIPPLSSHKQLGYVGVDEGDQDEIRCTDGAPVVWQFLGSMNPAGSAEANAKHSVSCSKNVWQQGNNEHSYRHPILESQAYASTGEFPFEKPQALEERMARLINLEAQMCDREDSESVALHVDNAANMLRSYANEDHNLLLSPCHKVGGKLPYFVQGHLDGLNKSGIHFVVTNDGLTQSSQFPPQFQEQQEMLLEQKQSREKDLYMHQILNVSMPSSGGFLSRCHFPLGGSQDWTSLQSPINGGLPGQNWLRGDNCTHGGWSGAESARSGGQCFGDTSSIDGSLFGVLSECNKLLSSSPYINMTSDHFPPGANFGSRGSPHGDGIYTYPPLLNNSSSRDAAPSKVNSMTWMNFSHQNPGVPESLRKSYLQSWNQ